MEAYCNSGWGIAPLLREIFLLRGKKTHGHHPKTWSQIEPSLDTWVSDPSVLMVFPAKPQLSLRETSSQCESQLSSIIFILERYVLPDEYFAVQQCLPPLSTHLPIGERVHCTHPRAHIPTKKCCSKQFSRVPGLSVLVKGSLK